MIDALLDKGVSIIGVDCAGVRRGKEHTPKDQYCADQGVFIIENLCNLQKVIESGGTCLINTYPMNYADMTGLPCRVVAESLDNFSLMKYRNYWRGKIWLEEFIT